MIKRPGNYPARKRLTPEERADRKAAHQAKIRERIVERVADAAILRHVAPVNSQPVSGLSKLMNNDKRTIGKGSSKMASVSLDRELLQSAKSILQGRIVTALEQHERAVGTKKESSSAASTRSATLILRSAIQGIDHEIEKY